jgi:hypothetical protein
MSGRQKYVGMKYVVSAYENSEMPDLFWIDEGGFDSADDAIRCAEAVVDRSLAGFFKPGMSAETLRMSYLCYGEVPTIFNDEGLNFETYMYVYRRIRELTGEIEWEPKSYGNASGTGGASDSST